jgi:hypothetical protein
MILINIILFIFSVIFIIISIYNNKNTHIINQKIDEQNKELENNNNKLLITQTELITKNKYFQEEQKKEQSRLLNIKNQTQEILETNKNVTQEAMQNYFNTLELAYRQEEANYNKRYDELERDYQNYCKEISNMITKEKETLASVQATRQAAIQAQLKEKEIKDNLNFYCLPISVTDRNDIQTLERVKSQLNKPRILSMLIWSTYFQKPMTSLCNNILGKSIKVGIYKITNQLNSMVYIGQAVDIATRWKNHAKCGLGIDTPANNKLYKAMIEDGIWNFSWELLEECPKEVLNEKEKYYIGLYDSYAFGYNSNAGIGSKK